MSPLKFDDRQNMLLLKGIDDAFLSYEYEDGGLKILDINMRSEKSVVK